MIEKANHRKIVNLCYQLLLSNAISPKDIHIQNLVDFKKEITLENIRDYKEKWLELYEKKVSFPWEIQYVVYVEDQPVLYVEGFSQKTPLVLHAIYASPYLQITKFTADLTKINKAWLEFIEFTQKEYPELYNRIKECSSSNCPEKEISYKILLPKSLKSTFWENLCGDNEIAYIEDI